MEKKNLRNLSPIIIIVKLGYNGSKVVVVTFGRVVVVVAAVVAVGSYRVVVVKVVVLYHYESKFILDSFIF